MPKPTYRLFTVSSGVVEPGVIVGKLTLKGAGKDIPAILVGQEGRGRKQDAVPVNLPDNLYQQWLKEGTVKIVAAALGKTHSDKWKLFVGDEADTEDEVICVFRTKYGFRGGNAHTGDRAAGKGPMPVFADFPGRILVKGICADGDAGRMASGEEIIAVMPRGVVFRTFYSGRLYGDPSAHYYVWTGLELLSATWDERAVGDLF